MADGNLLGWLLHLDYTSVNAQCSLFQQRLALIAMLGSLEVQLSVCTADETACLESTKQRALDRLAALPLNSVGEPDASSPWPSTSDVGTIPSSELLSFSDLCAQAPELLCTELPRTEKHRKSPSSSSIGHGKNSALGAGSTRGGCQGGHGCARQADSASQSLGDRPGESHSNPRKRPAETTPDNSARNQPPATRAPAGGTAPPVPSGLGRVTPQEREGEGGVGVNPTRRPVANGGFGVGRESASVWPSRRNGGVAFTPGGGGRA